MLETPVFGLAELLKVLLHHRSLSWLPVATTPVLRRCSAPLLTLLNIRDVAVPVAGSGHLGYSSGTLLLLEDVLLGDNRHL